MLPPHKFFVQPGGKLARVSEEKNGHELFDKMLDLFPATDAIPDAITWLVDKKLLDLNETDNQGKTSLEKILNVWLDKVRFYSTKAKQIADIAVKKGAKISSEKAAALLEKSLEKLFDENTELRFQDYNDLIGFLIKQSPHLDPLKAQQLEIKYFEKIINTKRHTELKPILDFLKTQAAPLSSEQATYLLKKAISADDKLLYNDLLDLGADPNMEVTDISGNKMSLLEYARKKDWALLEKVVRNPKTTADTMNKKVENNLTLAMSLAYEPKTPVHILKVLLNNQHLDINGLRTNHIGVVNYTLLDIIIDNCINLERGGHEYQKLQAIKQAEQWLNLLKSSELVQHPNFFVTTENIDKAKATLGKLTNNRGSYMGEEGYYNKSLEFAQKAVDFLKEKIKY
jgi:hypothetical protein